MGAEMTQTASVDGAKVHLHFADYFFDLITNLSDAFEGTNVLGPKLAILMTLYSAERSSFLHTLTSLSDEADMPHATMLRHLNEMVGRRWIMKTPDIKDNRIVYVRLAPATMGRINGAMESLST